MEQGWVSHVAWPPGDSGRRRGAPRAGFSWVVSALPHPPLCPQRWWYICICQLCTLRENNPVKHSVTGKSSSESPLLTLGESRHMVPGRSTGRNPQQWPLIPCLPSVHRHRAVKPRQTSVPSAHTPPLSHDQTPTNTCAKCGRTSTPIPRPVTLSLRSSEVPHGKWSGLGGQINTGGQPVQVEFQIDNK